ncbi:MAG: tetratricopeptide repeat protein [Verrucomicrobia bacterium]|nr:tetratricopeptide repeat protein [Verrucomicrobiota bacterium]
MQSLRFVHKHLVTAILIAGILTSCSREGKISGLLQKADTDFKAGNYDTARIEYLNVLHLDAQNETAIQQLGTIWFEDGAPLRALPFLRKIKDLRPTNLDTRVKLANTLVSLGDAPNAKKEALAILNADPTNGEAIILLAETSRTPKELDETAQRLQRFDGIENPSKYIALAALSTRKGDLDAAGAAIQHVLALDSKSVSAHLAKAELLLLKGESAQAALELRTAADLAPLRSTARLKYAELEADTGHLADANRILKEITSRTPDYLPAWGSLAKLAYKQKNYGDSLALLENIFNRDPMNPEGRLLQSDVLLAKGDIKSVLEVLDRLNAVFPQLPIAKYQLARAHLQNDNPTQAIAELNKALGLNPDYLDATLLLGEADLRAGDPQAVLTSMQRLLDKHPNLAPARELLAAAYRSLGQLDDAANTFRDQISASPGNAQAYLGLGLILRQQGKLTEARNAFEKAQQLDPQNPSPVGQLVDLDVANQDFSAALQKVQNQRKGNPKSPVADFLEAKIYFAQGQWDRAESVLLTALQLDPNDSKAEDLLIYTYIAANKLPDALSRVNSTLSRQPNDERMLMLCGLIYEKMNQFTNARDAYEKLLSLEPRFEAALNNLAWLYAEKFGQLDKAYDLARKARALEPDAGAIADTLGWILYKRGDYAQALSQLKDAAAKLPNNSQVQFHLGMAYYMMGQIDLARAALSRVMSDSSDFPGKQDAERKLALLGSGSANTPPSVDKLEEIVKQQPDDIVAQLLLGDAYEKLGQFASAAQAYRNAVKVNQQLVPAYVRLAKIYGGPLGDREKASEFASKVRELAPSDGG